MPKSSTGDEALNGGAAEDLKDLPGSTETGSDEHINEGAPAAESPAAETKDDNKPKSIADAVRAALDKGEEHSSSSGEDEGLELDPKKTPGVGEEPKEGEEEIGDPTADETKTWSPKTQRRFQKLVTTTKELNTRVSELEPKAQIFDNFEKYTKNANLSREDVNTGLEVMRLLRNDPTKGYEVLTPIYEQLKALVGEVLPKDLQDQVNGGAITAVHAKELSRLRAERSVNQNVQVQNQEREAQRLEAEKQASVSKLVTDVEEAMQKWETGQKTSDPDYSAKQGRILEAIDLELRRAMDLAAKGLPNKLPKSPADALALANEVKKRIDKELRQFSPKRTTEITHIGGNGITNGSKPVARSLHEAVRLAVGHK